MLGAVAVTEVKNRNYWIYSKISSSHYPLAKLWRSMLQHFDRECEADPTPFVSLPTVPGQSVPWTF